MRKTLEDYSNLVKEFNFKKNAPLTPKDFSYGTPKKVWWECIKGHEWFSSVNHRTNGRNCPKCSGGSSKPEFRILSELETIFKIVDSRHKFKKTEIDIFVKDINVGIEYDGFYYHNNRADNDIKKNIFLKKYIKKLIRVRHSPLKKLDNFDVIVKKDELTKKDLNNILNSIYNFCNNEQKILIKEYLNKSSFVNEESYNKYLSYFPSPIPEKSLTSLNLQFVKEWNYEKNYPLTPDSFSTKSNTKVWWKCTKGHEWKTVIANRTTGRNCPYCSGRKVSKENNLKFLFPEIAKEWHPTKNDNLKPENFVKGSGKKVWWKCTKGHEWEAVIWSRTDGRDCPNCSGKRLSNQNNLKFIFPEIAKEWHPTKNNSLSPEEVTKYSSKKVWWKCTKGHEWKTTVSNRTNQIRRTNCPHCFNIKRKNFIK
jgi:Zn finger protein HypA/HybF involved in hydrogenase expression